MVLSQISGKRVCRGTRAHGKDQDRDKRRMLVVKKAQIREKTQDLHSFCSCWVSRKLFYPRNTGIYRYLKHLSYKGRYNEVINSMRTI